MWAKWSLKLFLITFEGELLVIEEFCAFGNMHDYLIANRDSFVNELNENGTDIAEGLKDYVNFAQLQQLQEDDK